MTQPAVSIASVSVVIGLIVMLLSVAIVLGFKREVRSQVVGFGGHIQVKSYSNYYGEGADSPIKIDTSLIAIVNAIDGVKCAQPIATTAAMIKTDDDFKGVVLKGVDSLYDWSFFDDNMIEGSRFMGPNITELTNGAIISKSLSDRLGIKLGERITIYIFKERLRARKLTITGIYSTSFSDYDNTYILTSAEVVQRINAWQKDEFSLLELMVHDYNSLDATSDAVFLKLAYLFDNNTRLYQIDNIKEQVPAIFEWLDMLDINSIVILLLMIIVSGFCMISGLLILILERSETIGVLKALGASNMFIRKIFLWQSTTLIAKSMLCGNIIALLLMFVQWQWHLIPLDPASYYVDYVPIYMNTWIFIGLNLSVFFVTVLMMVGPTYLTTRISPVEAMRKE